MQNPCGLESFPHYWNWYSNSIVGTSKETSDQGPPFESESRWREPWMDGSGLRPHTVRSAHPG